MSQSLPRDPRKVHVPAPDPLDAPRGSTSYAPPAPARRPAPRSAPVRTKPVAAPPRAKPARRKPRGRRALKLLVVALPLLLLLGLLGGYLYARSVFNRIEKIELADVLTGSSEGTNYLIVGSDTRDLEALADVGLNPAGFMDGGGQRSDTMMLLRFVDGEAKMMSIPRDLYLPIAEAGSSNKINAAYNGGPRRLVLTVQQSLGIPIDHYMEVDFVSFAKLVDALGGITIDFPHPAFDRGSGLDIQQAGPNELSGPEALAFVRSRHYVEVVDGVETPDPTGDLGRVKRQQQFLTTVFAKLGESKNPMDLAQAASSTTDGLRIDDTLTLTDAMRLGWRLRSLDPESVELPVELGRNEKGSVLFLVQPGADEALGQFR